MQAYLAQQLNGRTGAIVVINPQNGDVLGMYSNPSYSLADAQDLDSYLKLEGNKREKPLLNRATREFYVPGSTFKTFTMISAVPASKMRSSLVMPTVLSRSKARVRSLTRLKNLCRTAPLPVRATADVRKRT
jgi:cell division protein FtsI/penicillin-binding protein 2